MNNDNNIVSADILVPDVRVSTYPQGPRGVGISFITLDGEDICFHMDNGQKHFVSMPQWWFGTKSEYYAMSEEQKKEYVIHFIEE